MSTQAEIQDILRPYVERHSDLVLIGRAVILRPIRQWGRKLKLPLLR